MRIDMMIDIETLGKRSDSTIFQIAAATFDIETGEVFHTFNQCADIELSDLNADGSTVKWWLKTNPGLLATLLNEGEGSPIELLQSFHKWMSAFTDDKENDVYLWGNGILFDNKMIAHQFESNGLPYPIFFRNDRDMRTIVELGCIKQNITKKELNEMFKDENLTLHNAYDDVLYQIRMVSQCYRWLT